jgi:hypothetical protein
MANGLVDPPSNSLGLTSGSPGGGTTGSKTKRNLIIGGIGAVVLVGIYIYAKNKSASTAASSGTSTSPADVIEPASNTDTTVSGIASSLSAQNQQLLQQEQANGTSLTNSLSNVLSSIEASIAGSQGAILSAVSSSKSTAPATPAAAPVTALPTLNPADFPKTVEYGQYTSGEYTQIGTVTNGVYNGSQVSGDAPVYANVFGGFEQGYNAATLPSGTGIYIPTALKAYIVPGS